jgi:hypothetical protein
MIKPQSERIKEYLANSTLPEEIDFWQHIADYTAKSQTKRG